MRPLPCVSLAVACVAALCLAARAETAAGTNPGDTACRPCHRADRPTAGDSALAPCARTVPRGTRPVSEGPVTLLMNAGAEHYGQVVFPHKAHAEMSETGKGCSECHHEATEGQPMRKCGECHSASRLRTDIEKPDLRGAIHRQCLGCHQQWDPANRCGGCHAAETAEAAASGKRPESDTAFSGGVLCKLHKSMTCSACHKTARAFRQGTLSCESCHAGWQKTFDHAKTGLALDDTHREASCSDCHGSKTFTTPPSCTACHTDKTYPADKPGRKLAVPAQRSPP